MLVHCSVVRLVMKIVYVGSLYYLTTNILRCQSKQCIKSRGLPADIFLLLTHYFRRHGHTWERNCDELRRIIESQFAARAKCEQTENTKDFDLIQAQVWFLESIDLTFNLYLTISRPNRLCIQKSDLLIQELIGQWSDIDWKYYWKGGKSTCIAEEKRFIFPG